MAMDDMQAALGASAAQGRVPMGTSAYDGVNNRSADTGLGQAVARMSRQAADPAFQPTAARGATLQAAELGGARYAIRVGMGGVDTTGLAAQTQRNIRTLAPATPRAEAPNFWSGVQG